MNRTVAIILGLFFGLVLGIAGVTLAIGFKYPDYYRDAGSPPILPGIIIGGPLGIVAGAIVGAIWPLRRR